MTLPDGHTARPPRLEDAAAIAAHVRSYTHAVLGFADYTVDDARDELTEPEFDPEHDGRLVHDVFGRPAGWATVSARRGGDQLGVDVVAPDAAVSAWLFDWALGRVRELARARGLARVVVDHGCYRADEVLRVRLAAQGFGLATTFHRMRVDHHGVVAPEPPAGVKLVAPDGEAGRRVAHELLMTSFADHFGFVPKTFDEWHEGLVRQSVFDWSQLWVAELDDSPVGVLLCTDQFRVEENCGYVSDLGVLPAARGRGVATYLLRHAFAVDAAAGRTGTVLHVDSNNTTPALGVYTSVGMRPVLVIDLWRADLET